MPGAISPRAGESIPFGDRADRRIFRGMSSGDPGVTPLWFELWMGAVTTVTYTTRRDGACLFYVDGGATNSEGLAYFPDRAPIIGRPGPGGIGYKPLHGPRYCFVENT